MKNIFLKSFITLFYSLYLGLWIAAFLFLLSIQGFAQSVEQINPQDPNYSIELNDLLQNFGANITTGNNNINTLQGYFSNNLLNTASGGTAVNSSNWPIGSLVDMSATGTWNYLAPSTSGYLLTSQGASAVPAWVASNNAMILVSTTSVSAASNSGNISITAGNYYKIIISARDVSSSNNQLSLRVNADNGNNYNYGYVGEGSTGALTGHAALASSILIAPSITANNPFTINADLTPDASGGNNLFIFGHVNSNFASGGYGISSFGSQYGGSAAITNFIVLGAGNWTGTVYLYQIIL